MPPCRAHRRHRAHEPDDNPRTRRPPVGSVLHPLGRPPLRALRTGILPRVRVGHVNHRDTEDTEMMRGWGSRYSSFILLPLCVLYVSVAYSPSWFNRYLCKKALSCGVWNFMCPT